MGVASYRKLAWRERSVILWGNGHLKSAAMPLILAIESSSHVGAIALVRVGDASGASYGEVVRNEIKLSGWMLPAVQRALAEAKIRNEEIDAVAFGAGPGSFSGVRTACATAQALAYAWRKPLISVDSLEALAEASQLPSVSIVIDARMQEVYSASFVRDDSAALRRLSETTVITPTSIRVQDGCAALGSGAYLLPQLEGNAVASPEQTAFAEANWALGVARVAARKLKLGLITRTTSAEPFYVRNNVAQTEAERAAVAAR